jgi:very-short-patch-repair endonuclease
MDFLWYIHYNQSLLNYAKENRKHPTRQEWLFWNLVLKNKKFMWYKFTRQKPIWSYILDFYCSKLLLWIEIDGWCHDENQEYDMRRDSEIRHSWIQIIRFRNKDIENDMDWVIRKLSIKIYKIERDQANNLINTKK